MDSERRNISGRKVFTIVINTEDCLDVVENCVTES